MRHLSPLQVGTSTALEVSSTGEVVTVETIGADELVLSSGTVTTEGIANFTGTIRLVDDPGTGGQVLTTNGTGNPAVWVTPFSGTYDDLTGKPTLFDGSWASLTGKPTISGSNTGDQTSIVGITGTIAQFNSAITDGDLATGGGTATGANTGDQTLNSLLPVQTGNSGKVLSTDGTNSSWTTASGSALDIVSYTYFGGV